METDLMEQKRDIENRADVEFLVSTFYHQATQDDLIGFFFTDVAAIDLDEHLPIMYNFWENILFQTGNYPGGMMYKHIQLNQKEKMQKKHFERWFALFEQTVDTNFAGPNAEEAKSRARMVVQTMPLKLNPPSRNMLFMR
jgi:hemoglobin